MSEHAWCRDVRRDEAVRAAEDAAAAERTPLPDHRDLPQAVADLRERVARLATKHNALVDLARLDAGWVKTKEDCLAAERDAAIRERDAAREECGTLKARVAELESAFAANAGGESNQPQPPRGWLTEEEREEVQWAADAAYDKQHPAEDTLRALLARSTPPRVKVPRGNSDLRTVRRDNDWIAAIRAAGGEVE